MRLLFSATHMGGLFQGNGSLVLQTRCFAGEMRRQLLGVRAGCPVMGHTEAMPETSPKAGTRPAGFSRSELKAPLFLVIAPPSLHQAAPSRVPRPIRESPLCLVCFLRPENIANALPSLKRRLPSPSLDPL